MEHVWLLQDVISCGRTCWSKCSSWLLVFKSLVACAEMLLRFRSAVKQLGKISCLANRSSRCRFWITPIGKLAASKVANAFSTTWSNEVLSVAVACHWEAARHWSINSASCRNAWHAGTQLPPGKTTVWMKCLMCVGSAGAF